MPEDNVYNQMTQFQLERAEDMNELKILQFFIGACQVEWQDSCRQEWIEIIPDEFDELLEDKDRDAVPAELNETADFDVLNM